jgi:deoxyribodipyrimidine photo-lyase
MKSALWWIRRDLRLGDNQALQVALGRADQVIPVFVLDPALLNTPAGSERRLAFLLAGLRQLDQDLRSRGSRLIVRRGKPAQVLAQVYRESGASLIAAEADYSPYARRRDQSIANDLPLQLVHSLVLHPLESTTKQDGSPYTVFTPFSRRWREIPRPVSDSFLPAPPRLTPPPQSLESEALPDTPVLASDTSFVPGEREANRRLEAFCQSLQAPIYNYGSERDRLDKDSTSRLSPYLRFGMLSTRQVLTGATQALDLAPTELAREEADSWLNELIWREFYRSILYFFPHVLAGNFRPAYDRMEWLQDQVAFDAWREGLTGYPVVDAGMRQLAATGWMHNRARMLTASFLVKDLLIDWRWGERWFMQQLLDGDPAANNGGWQWTAGTGTDAAPYFRIFNPTRQGKKFDPDGAYVRRWVPELETVPDRYVHHPWDMPDAVQASSGVVIGRHYPAPLVDHKWARERMLAAYKRARNT